MNYILESQKKINIYRSYKELKNGTEDIIIV